MWFWIVLACTIAAGAGAGWYVGRYGFHGAWATVAAGAAAAFGVVASWLSHGGPTP